MPLTLSTTAFMNGARIPREHTCEGADVSPALSWRGAPLGTKSFALIVDDPDAPNRTWNHWLLWNIPTSVESLREGFEPGQVGVSGANDFGAKGYGGPCPPPGHGVHRYFFRLYALDTDSLGLAEGASRAGLDAALEGHVIEKAEYMGTYERKG